MMDWWGVLLCKWFKNTKGEPDFHAYCADLEVSLLSQGVIKELACFPHVGHHFSLTRCGSITWIPTQCRDSVVCN